MRLLTSETSNKGETPHKNETHKKYATAIFKLKRFVTGKIRDEEICDREIDNKKNC